MSKPSIEDMTNRTAINEGISQQRTTGYTLSDEQVKTRKEYCLQPNDWSDGTVKLLTNGESGDNPIERVLKPEEIIAGNTIPLTGYRNADKPLNLTTAQKQQVASRGRTITPIDQLRNGRSFDYSRESATDVGTSEERITLYRIL